MDPMSMDLLNLCLAFTLQHVKNKSLQLLHYMFKSMVLAHQDWPTDCSSICLTSSKGWLPVGRPPMQCTCLDCIRDNR